MKQVSLGCDLGSSSVKIAVLDEDNKCLATRYQLHGGEALKVFTKMVAQIESEFGERIGWAMVTGAHVKAFQGKISCQ